MKYMHGTIEETEEFTPKFDANGLIPCVAIDDTTSEVLMVAYMNEESIHKSLATGEAHYYSRSRQEIWHKGATSGNTQKIIEMKTDCDQDCLLIRVQMPKQESGQIAACHTGRESCFYRIVKTTGGTIKLQKQD